MCVNDVVMQLTTLVSVAVRLGVIQEFIVIITHVTEQQSNEIPSNNSVQET